MEVQYNEFNLNHLKDTKFLVIRSLETNYTIRDFSIITLFIIHS